MRVMHDSHSPTRVEVIVPAGAELEVPEQVAAQLTAASRRFRVKQDSAGQGETDKPRGKRGGGGRRGDR